MVFITYVAYCNCFIVALIYTSDFVIKEKYTLLAGLMELGCKEKQTIED
jgi:hypothetical protein